MKVPKWGEPPLESSLPHILIDTAGAPRSKVLKNRAVATRLLNQLRRKPSPFLMGDPKNWKVHPVTTV